MKRAFFEWGAIATSTLALACFVYWMVSRTTPIADFELSIPVGHMQVTPLWASNGSVTIGRMDEIETISKARIVNPPLNAKHRWASPGLLYHSIDWGGQLSWSLRVSMWIPTLLASLAAAFFIHGYLRVRRHALSLLRSTSRQHATTNAPGATVAR